MYKAEEIVEAEIEDDVSESGADLEKTDEATEEVVENEADQEIDGEIDGEEIDSDDETVEEEEEELLISIGEDAPTPDAEGDSNDKNWVKNLRTNFREVAREKREFERENRELQEKIKSLESEMGNGPVSSLPSEPSLEEYDFDEKKYKNALANWLDQKRQFDAEEENKKQASLQQQKEWEDQMAAFDEQKERLKKRVRNFEDAENIALNKLSVHQQGMIVQACDEPAHVMYVLGNNMEKLSEVAQTTDPVKFIAAVSKLETKMKITTHKKPPQPEKTFRGSGGTASSSNETLNRLRSEAERTNDYSKVREYKDKLRFAKK